MLVLLAHQMQVVIDEEDVVARRDAAERHEADERRDRDRLAGHEDERIREQPITIAIQIRKASRVQAAAVDELPANLPVGSPIEVTIRYDAQARVHVEAKELVSGKTAPVTLPSKRP